jgi:hypothetical protein
MSETVKFVLAVITVIGSLIIGYVFCLIIH